MRRREVYAFIFVLFREGMNKVIFITAFSLILFFILALITNIELLLFISLALNVIGFTIINVRSYQRNIIFYTAIALAVISFILYRYTNIFSDKTLLLAIINTALMSLLMLVLFIIKKNKNIILFLSIIIGVAIFVLSVDFVFNNIYAADYFALFIL